MAEQSDFQKRLMQIGIHGTIASTIALGHELHLFEALAKVGSEENPATPKQVADESGCKERYVEEWLSAMAAGEIIEVNEEEKFWIPKENVEDLTSGLALQFNLFLPLLLKSYDNLCNVFRKDGPLGLNYSDFTGFYQIMSSFSEAMHKKHLVSDFLPALGADIPERLKEGGMMCLDVGCGNGFHAALLAETFPKSNFSGIDITLEAVHQANQRRKDDGLTFDNLAFIQMNAGEMDANWTNKFDVVTIFDACHDQMRPDLCLKEIYRVLKPGGIFGMLEIKGSSNVYTDRKEIGELAAHMYGCSVLHCLPVGSNSPDALGLGTMWGKERAKNLLRQAGFTNISIVPTTIFPVNDFYGQTSSRSLRKKMTEQTEFQKRLMQIGIHGTISAIIALGYELHLFEALAKVGSEEKPATPKQVADESGCKERYVKEWLSVMATGDIIEVNEEEKFWIPKEHIGDLTSGVNLQMNLFLPLHLKSFDSLCAVFKKDGPLGLKYSDFTGFYKVMSEFSESMHKKHLVSDFIPALGSDLPARLKEGGLTCLDVGCGNGFHAAFLAQNFPNSKFTGIDVISGAVNQANQRRKDDGQAFDNLTFIQMDAGKMDPNWSNKFDMVTIFDACHDQMRPDLCLKEIYRVLKPGGVFGMLEIKGSSNVYTDRKEIGLFSAQLYGASVFHCLPVGSNSPDALALGTMWGKERAVKLLKEAGFNNISVVPTPQFAINVLYVCKKE
nr:Methyltransferase type 11 domain containing protein [Haemonchus contortus]